MSHNVTIATPHTPPRDSDPLNILRHATHTTDHSYSEGSDGATTTTAGDVADPFGLGSQFSSIRSAFANSSFAAASSFGRGRGMLNVDELNNNPLSRLSNTTTTGASTSTTSSRTSVSTASTDTPGATTTTASGVSDSLTASSSRGDAKDGGACRSDDAARTTERDAPSFHREQSLNFDENNDVSDTDVNGSGGSTRGDVNGGRGRGRVEVITIDDDDF